MLAIKGLTYKIGDRVIFDNASVTFVESERYAITGINGSGKSTLFSIIKGDIERYEGTIGKKGKVSILRQHLTSSQLEMSTMNFIIQGDEELWSVMQRRERLYEMEFNDEVGMEMADCEDKISELGGYEIESRIERMAEKIGIQDGSLNIPVKSISNSDKMKAALVKALISSPDILMLDEPTNGIDIFAIEWLKTFLRDEYKGLLLFISHDVDFVNSLATSVADIDYKDIIIYPGNFYDMVETKRSIQENMEKEQATIAKKAEKIKAFITRFGAGTRASQAKSKAKQFNKLSEFSVRQSNIAAPYIMFDFGSPSASLVMDVRDISKKDLEGNVILDNLSFRVERGDRIAVLGKGGSGKSVLLKMIVRKIIEDEGQFVFGKNVKVGYFPQNHKEIFDEDSKEMTILEWVTYGLENNADSARSVLGRMLFTSDDVHKKIRCLSGGETVRAILSKIILDGANLIILDEPCSHLDIGSVASLKNAVALSRDKTFIVATNGSLNDICEKKVIFEEDGGAIFYVGSFQDYQESRKMRKKEKQNKSRI